MGHRVFPQPRHWDHSRPYQPEVLRGSGSMSGDQLMRERRYLIDLMLREPDANPLQPLFTPPGIGSVGALRVLLALRLLGNRLSVFRGCPCVSHAGPLFDGSSHFLMAA